MPNGELVFKLPLVVGDTIGEYTIVSVNEPTGLTETINVPSNYSSVYQFERSNEIFIETITYAKGFGEIESIFNLLEDGEVVMTVTSQLEKLETIK